jgi:hypothetical protein
VTGFYLRIPDGRFGSLTNHAVDLADREAAWDELTLVCKDLVGSVVREISRNTEWQMELLDESKTPIYRIRVVSETLDGHLGETAPASIADEVR